MSITNQMYIWKMRKWPVRWQSVSAKDSQCKRPNLGYIDIPLDVFLSRIRLHQDLWASGLKPLTTTDVDHDLWEEHAFEGQLARKSFIEQHA